MRASVSVRVESDFVSSSFEISLIVDQGLLEQAKTFLIGHGITDAEGLIRTVLGGVSVASGAVIGIIKIFKALKGENLISEGVKHFV